MTSRQRTSRLQQGRRIISLHPVWEKKKPYDILARNFRFAKRTPYGILEKSFPFAERKGRYMAFGKELPVCEKHAVLFPVWLRLLMHSYMRQSSQNHYIWLAYTLFGIVLKWIKLADRTLLLGTAVLEINGTSHTSASEGKGLRGHREKNKQHLAQST